MTVLRRVVGLAFLLVAIAVLVVGSGLLSNDGESVLDSPEASGQMLGIIIPVALLGAIGIWLLFSRKRAR